MPGHGLALFRCRVHNELLPQFPVRAPKQTPRSRNVSRREPVGTCQVRSSQLLVSRGTVVHSRGLERDLKHRESPHHAVREGTFSLWRKNNRTRSPEHRRASDQSTGNHQRGIECPQLGTLLRSLQHFELVRSSLERA